MRISDWSSDVCSSDLLALVYGVMMTMPIGGADMPVVISLYNAFTGLAVGFEGYVLNNPALMIAGMVRSEEHTSELQPLMRISYAVFCLNKKNLQSTSIQNIRTKPTKLINPHQVNFFSQQLSSKA